MFSSWLLLQGSLHFVPAKGRAGAVKQLWEWLELSEGCSCTMMRKSRQTEVVVWFVLAWGDGTVVIQGVKLAASL